MYISKKQTKQNIEDVFHITFLWKNLKTFASSRHAYEAILGLRRALGIS